MTDHQFQTISNYSSLKSILRDISAFIAKYTSDVQVTSARKLLEESLNSRDKDSILSACNEFLSWYRKNIDLIIDNSYESDFDTHVINLEHLPQLIDVINANPDWFPPSTNDGNKRYAEKKKMIFISHSTKDREYVHLLVELLRKLGFTEENLFCSSYPGYGIPLGKKIYEFLKGCFIDYELFVLYVISKENYYSSPASLNEMGAAWVQSLKSIPILLPGMKPSDLCGVVGSDSLALVLDNDDSKYELNSLKNELLSFFELPDPNENAWEHDRDSFLEACSSIRPISLKAVEEGGSANADNNLDDLIEERVSLEKSLYRALVIAKKQSDESLESWVKSELNGYEDDDSTPGYRRCTSVTFRYSGINRSLRVDRVPLPPDFISNETMEEVKEVVYRGGIKQIEDYANSTNPITIDRSFLAAEVSRNTNGMVQCVSIEQLLSPDFFSTIVANVKEQLVNIFINNS